MCDRFNYSLPGNIYETDFSANIYYVCQITSHDYGENNKKMSKMQEIKLQSL